MLLISEYDRQLYSKDRHIKNKLRKKDTIIHLWGSWGMEEQKRLWKHKQSTLLFQRTPGITEMNSKVMKSMSICDVPLWLPLSIHSHTFFVLFWFSNLKLNFRTSFNKCSRKCAFYLYWRKSGCPQTFHSNFFNLKFPHVAFPLKLKYSWPINIKCDESY